VSERPTSHIGESLRTKLSRETLGMVLVLFVLPILRSQPASSLQLTPPSTVVPASLFGLHIHRPGADTWPQVPFAEWRLWDSKATVWYNLEPRKGQWSFVQTDQDVALAQQRGVGLLMTLGQTPPWASSRPDEPPTWRHGGAAPPSNEADWKNYVRTVATRYKGHIHEYEIWNEPNLKEFFTGTPEQLVTLAKDAYQVIHEVDPTATVVSPSITTAYGVTWLNSYLDAGGGAYADVIGYHFYVSPDMPEAEIDVIQRVKSALSAHGIRKQIWNTEIGWFIHSDFQDIQPNKGSFTRVLSAEEALAYVMRSYVLNWASGISRVYWYDWDGNPMGLGDNLGKQKKPAAEGYRAIEEWLSGAIIRSCSRADDNSWTCGLNREGRSEWIVWNPDHTVMKAVPPSWKVNEILTLSSTGTISSRPFNGGNTIQYAPLPALLR
jgi:hypothetical protein